MTQEGKNWGVSRGCSLGGENSSRKREENGRMGSMNREGKCPEYVRRLSILRSYGKSPVNRIPDFGLLLS